MSAQPQRHLRVVEVDDTSGEITYLDSEGLAALEAERDKLKADLANAERDLRGKRAIIANLERDKVRQRLEHPDREFIVRVCRYWHAKCRPDDHAKTRPRIDPISPDRFDAVAALAEMQEIRVVDGRRRKAWKYEAEHFKAAIDGAAFDPFVTVMRNGKPKPQNDLEQVCRMVSKFEAFIEKAPYEPVPLAGFTRPSPQGLKRLAKERAMRENLARGSKHAPSSGAPLGGTYGPGWFVGGAHGRFPVREQAGWLHVRHGVGHRVEGEPPAVA